MKAGSPFPDVVARVQSTALHARDFLAPARHLHVSISDEKPQLVLDDGSGAKPFAIHDLVHDQLAGLTDVPAPYYRRMLEQAPELLARNLNTWLGRGSQRHLVRTLQGNRPLVRAVLSDRYRPLDNHALVAALAPTLHAQGVKIVSSELTETKLHIKALNERLTGEVRVGEPVMAGIAISNSEVGLGALQVTMLVYTLRCTNGAVIEDASLRRHHVGKRLGSEDGIQHLLSDEAREADDRAFFLRVRDVAQSVLSEAVWRQQLGKLKVAAGQAIPAAEIERVVEVTARRHYLSVDEQAGVLAHLRHSGEYTRWGLSSAITRHSQDLESYDRASDLERIGGRVVSELPAADWARSVGLN